MDYRRSDDLLCLIWKDKRDVKLLSTMHDAEQSPTGKQDRAGNNITKPNIVLDYNKFMGGVDSSDMMTNVYADMRRSVKWYRKLVFHLSDLSVTNAYILYKKTTGKDITHSSFLLQVIKELLLVESQDVSSCRPIPKRRGRRSVSDSTLRLQHMDSRHWPSLIEPSPGAKKQNPQRQCAVCKPRPASAEGKRPESRYECRACNVGLHPQCFESYHTKKIYN